jgi:hypothetical protein
MTQRSEQGPPLKRDELVILVVLVVASALVSFALLRVSLVLGNDALAHLFNVWLGNHLEDVGTDYANKWERGHPVTTHGYHELFGLFEPLFGWRVAHALTIDVIVLVWIVGFSLLVCAVQGRLTAVALLGPATSLSWPLLMGLYPFVLACGLALIAIAFWVWRGSNARLVDFAIVALLLLLTASAHPTAAIIGGTLIVAAHVPRDRGALVRTWTGLAIAGVPAIVLTLMARESAADVALAGGTLFLPLTDRILDLGERFAGGPWWRGALPLALAVVGLVVATRSTRSSEESARSSDVRAPSLALGAFAWLLLSLAMPWQWSGWQFASVRPLPLAIMVLAAGASLPRARAGRLVSSVLISLVSFGSILWGARTLDRIDIDNRAVAAALDGFPRSSAHRITVVLRRPPSPPIDRSAPLLHVGQLASLVLGGSDHYGQDQSPPVHMMLRLPGFCGDAVPTMSDMARAMDADPTSRPELVRAVLRTAHAHDEVVVLAHDEDRALIESAGFTIVADAAGVFLVRPR